MKNKKKSSPDMHFADLSKNQQDDNPDKRDPNPDDPNEQIGPPVKEMPVSVGPHHPHHEEILDGTPK